MRLSSFAISLLLAYLGLVSTAQAQFSVFGGGSMIPVSGDGGDLAVQDDGLAVFPTTQAGLWATSTVTVPEAVTQIDSIRIDGFEHSWAGDVQATLMDPSGAEHLIFLRPGYLNTSAFGTAGNFQPGSYTFVESGGAELPMASDNLDIAPGTYNQRFDSGGATWVSGTNNIFNTPLSTIAGAAGVWELRLYDWANGDSGAFTGWTLNGNNYMETSGAAYCFGDGTGVACPCGANGGPGEGCLTTSGTGAVLSGMGDAVVGNDTFQLFVTGAPADKPGLFFQGSNQISNLVGDGLLCANADIRNPVNATDLNGEASQGSFGLDAMMGQTINYQYWFRDPSNPCGGGFNFSNGWNVTWQ